jgi:integrase
VLDLETFKLRASGVYPKSTLERKLVALSLYDRFLEERGLQPGIESLGLWLDELRKRGLSPNTIGAYGRDVLSYFDLMMIEVDEKKARMLKRMLPPVRVGKVDVLTKDEVAKLIESTSNLRNKLIYLLCYSYGRRLGEVLALTKKDVNLEKGTITFPILKRKSKETATYELEPMIRDLLAEYVRIVKGDKLFPITRRAVEIAFKKDCERAGIRPRGRRLRVHILRHSRVTHLIEDGVPIEVVSKVLARHTNIATTFQFYTAPTPEMASKIPKATEILFGGGRGGG